MSTSTAWSRCCASNWNWNWKRSSSSSSSSSCSSSSRRSARQHGNHRRRTPLNPRNNTRERRFSARRHLRCNGQKNHDDFETFDEMLENFLEPPRRDTGIPSEWDINIDIDEGTRRSSRGIAIFRRDDGFSFLYHTSSEYTRRTNLSFAHLLSAYSSFFSRRRRKRPNRTREENERGRPGHGKHVVSRKWDRPRRRRVPVPMDGERGRGAG